MEELLQQTIRAGLQMKAVTPAQLARVNVDTTVEEKHVRFPTDARLYDRSREVNKRYEFGVKVSVATTSKGGWHVGAMSCPDNPYDGHTLGPALEQMSRIAGTAPSQVFVDAGYRGHGCLQGKGNPEVHVDKKRRGKIAQRLWNG